MLLRTWRGGQLGLIVWSLVLAVSVVTSVSLLAERIERALTAESTSEQAGAGLDQCTPDELTQFQSLNKEYTARFGFPFIVAVAGYQRAEILEIFQSRVANSLEVEFSTALEQVHKIARLRLTALAQEG